MRFQAEKSNQGESEVGWFRGVGYFFWTGRELPQTGHTFSVGLTIGVSLHLGHLTGWSLTRLISSGSREVCIGITLQKIQLIHRGGRDILEIALETRNLNLPKRCQTMLLQMEQGHSLLRQRLRPGQSQPRGEVPIYPECHSYHSMTVKVSPLTLPLSSWCRVLRKLLMS